MTTRSKIAAVVGIAVLAAGALALAYVATDRERAFALFGGAPTEAPLPTRATVPAQPAPETAETPPAPVDMATRPPGPRPQMVDPDAPLAAGPRLVSPGRQEPRRVVPQGRDVAEPPAEGAAKAQAQQQAAIAPKPAAAPVQQAAIPPVAAEAPAPAPAQQQAVVSPKPVAKPPAAGDAEAQIQQTAVSPKPAPEPVQQAALPPAKDIIPATMPDFDIVRVDAKGGAVIAGRAEPDCVVTVLDGDRAIGEVRADNRGEWVLLPDSALPPGSRELSLSQACGDGGAAKSQQVVILVIPEPGRDLAGRPVKRPVMPLVMKVERGGGGAAVVLQTPTLPDPELVVGVLAGKDEPLTRAAPAVAPARDPRARPPAGRMQVTVDAVSYNDDGRIVVAGKAPPDSRQRAYLDNRFIGEADADADGRWSLTPEEPIAPGFYKLRVDQVDAAGAVVARVELPFIRGEPMTDLPEGALVVVQPGNSLWRIARRVYGQGIEYSVIYSANSRQIADPDMIYPGQIFVLPQTN
ncbi:MAG: LysM peptidoglycan-binding domain-containing protein [Alphaproteobacteria bacterium]